MNHERFLAEDELVRNRREWVLAKDSPGIQAMTEDEAAEIAGFFLRVAERSREFRVLPIEPLLSRFANHCEGAAEHYLNQTAKREPKPFQLNQAMASQEKPKPKLKIRLGTVTGFHFPDAVAATQYLAVYGGTLQTAAGGGFLWIPPALPLPLNDATQILWRYALIPPGTKWQNVLEIFSDEPDPEE